MQIRTASVPLDVFAIEEVALAANVPMADVQGLVDDGVVVPFRGFIAQADAVRLLRHFAIGAPSSELPRALRVLAPPSRRRHSAGLIASAFAHAAFVLLAVAAANGLLTPATAPALPAPQPARLVYLVLPGPGGGGGGGGLHMPSPPPTVAVRAAAPKARVAAPVPPRTRVPPPPRPQRPARPIPTYRLQPRPLEPPREMTPQVVEVPMVAAARAEPVEQIGLPAAKPAPPSAGPGANGGVGSGIGTGMGQGTGGGLGDGSGGGTGGGPYRPGSGVDAPMLVREVRPTYTEEARRKGIEGDVLLEVTVLRDGRVGDVKVVRRLGAGLDQKAIDAVQQWRFNPARRQGTPVDVSVQVAVGFSLR